MSAPRDTPEGLLADVAQMLFTVLFLYPDDVAIPVPRTWIAQWYRDISTVLDHIRQRP